VSVLIEGFVESPGDILIAGAEESSRSLAEGVWAQFGPFTFLIAVGVVIGAAMLVARSREEEETSNFIPGLPGGLDVPIIGTDEE
jgi:hypothetical protein